MNKFVADFFGTWSLLAPWSPVATWSFALVVVGAFTLLFAFLPGFISTVRSKNTASMSLLMWILSVAGLACLSIFYLLGTISTAEGAVDKDGVALNVPAPHFLIVLICEFISCILSTYILMIKVINMQKAKKLGITEEEYCKTLAKKNIK